MNGGDSRIASVFEALPEEQSRDRALDVLSDRQRRSLLAVLYEDGAPKRLSALARRIASDPEHDGLENADWVHINLHHCHVPKLADLGFVSWDRTWDVVELTDRGRTVAAVLGESSGEWGEGSSK